MKKIILNHKIRNKDDFKIYLDNRAFLYGDGLFESVRIINGKPFNLEAHLNRLFSGALLLNLKIDWSKRDIQNDVELLIKENKIKKAGSMKILIFREEGGKYLPENNQTSFLMMCEEFKQNRFELNKKGLTLGLFSKQLKPLGKLSNFKTISALQSVICSIEAKKMGKDDCLMFNSENRIIESSNSNVFYTKNNIVYTPKLLEGCVDGTMRNCVLRLNNSDLLIKETTVKLEQILMADEVFLTNANQGVRWVSKVENRVFKHQEIAQSLIKKINLLI